MKYSNKLGFFYLKSPIMKKITYSKGETVRCNRHFVFGIGYVDDSFVFKGMILFDFFERCLLVLVLLIGGSSASGNIYNGLFWTGMFYLLIVFLSWNDDDSNLHRVQRMCQLHSQ